MPTKPNVENKLCDMMRFAPSPCSWAWKSLAGQLQQLLHALTSWEIPSLLASPILSKVDHASGSTWQSFGVSTRSTQVNLQEKELEHLKVEHKHSFAHCKKTILNNFPNPLDLFQKKHCKTWLTLAIAIKVQARTWCCEGRQGTSCCTDTGSFFLWARILRKILTHLKLSVKKVY